MKFMKSRIQRLLKQRWGCASPFSRHFPKSAFTLIELLIVVAIIGILAAIAIPNFLNAQTRAKVSRAMADLRTIATGIEAYSVDWNIYPLNDGRYGTTPNGLTTPIQYFTLKPFDPFALQAYDERGLGYDEDAKFYSYHRIVTLTQAIFPLDPPDAIDTPGANEGAFERYGKWNQLSIGPDQRYADGTDFWGNVPYSFDIPYDPTNGLTSWGNIIMTQKEGLEFTLRL